MSMRYKGARLSATPPTTTGGTTGSGSAPGLWTLEQQMQAQGQSAWPGAGNYIEDVFSTYLYTGNGSTQTITNNIDLSTYGGLVWIKNRSAAWGHVLARQAQYWMSSNTTAAENTADATSVSSYNNNGFSVGSRVQVNNSGENFVSWTFRKQAKFFDVVTYTGDGTSNRAISHNLGSTPGFILVKATSTTGDWYALHRVGNAGSWGVGTLNSTGAFSAPSPLFWGNGTTFTAPTSTTFTVSADGGNLTNGSGVSFVAYLFAHDAGGFGAAGTDNVISCGSYTGNGSATGPVINLGWEPQWILLKPSTVIDNWNIIDNMRGFTVGGSNQLYANATNAEGGVATNIAINATGFQPNSTNSGVNGNGQTYIYIAIRRGPMKTPTSGTSVFIPVTASIPNSPYTVTTNFPSDLTLSQNRPTGFWCSAFDRLRWKNAVLNTSSTAAESVLSTPYMAFDSNVNVVDNYNWIQAYNGSTAYWNFRRAPGFFDVVCYTGTGVARTVSHNLGVVPELMIVKVRNQINSWLVYAAPLGATKRLFLSDTSAEATSSAFWNNTAPTSSVFTVGTADGTNLNTGTFVAYLFATVAGVSKVGSYTGNGSSQTINCGFAAGARFVLIKRTDSTGDWYVWDSARGISAAGVNDPYLLLNSTAAEVTTNDSLSAQNAGFGVIQNATTNINVTSATYIFLAIA